MSSRLVKHDLIKDMKNVLFPITFAAALLALAVNAQAKILWKLDFNGKDPCRGLNLRALGYRPAIVPDPKNPENKVMCAVHSFARHNKRSEVQIEQIPTGEERWIGVRIMQIDPVPAKWTCFFQVGPIGGNPSHPKAGLYQLDAFGTPNWTMRGWLGRAGRRDFGRPLGSIRYGEWTSWVFHIKLRANSSGLFEVWKDGVRVLEDRGQNAWPDDKMCIQWGIYHGVLDKGEKDIRCLYDDVTIGDAKSNYQEVAPKPHKAASKPAQPNTTNTTVATTTPASPASAINTPVNPTPSPDTSPNPVPSANIPTSPVPSN
jgi:hypothetical protein